MTPTMTIREVGELLKTAQRYDGRTIAEGNVEGWILALVGLRYKECTAAIIQHYANETAFVMPAHVRCIVNTNRDHERPPAPDTESHCGRPSCRCTHTDPCDYGFVPSVTVQGGMVPCPICSPGRQGEHGESRKQWMTRLQTQDLAWQRDQRKKDPAWTPHAAAEGK